jgi:hypothetical protein
MKLKEKFKFDSMFFNKKLLFLSNNAIKFSLKSLNQVLIETYFSQTAITFGPQISYHKLSDYKQSFVQKYERNESVSSGRRTSNNSISGTTS